MHKQTLNQRQLLTIGYYMEGATKVDSMIMAGYPDSSAHKNHTQTFGHPTFKKEVTRRQDLLMEKNELSEDWVIKRLMRIACADEILAKYRKIFIDGTLYWDFTGAPEEDLAVIHEMTVAIDKQGNRMMKILPESPAAAVVNLGRKLGMFKDNVNVTSEASLVERINKGREQARLEHQGEEDGTTDS